MTFYLSRAASVAPVTLKASLTLYTVRRASSVETAGIRNSLTVVSDGPAAHCRARPIAGLAVYKSAPSLETNLSILASFRAFAAC